MKKKIFGMIILIAFAIGYNIHRSAKTSTIFSELVLANVEALANDSEIPGTNCDATMDKECCVCFGRHHTYARPHTTTGACEHRVNCSHYNN